MKNEDMKKEKNYGAGKNCLPYDENPEIGGTDDAKKTNKAMETSMFGKDALESGIAATPSYAAGSKKEYFKPSGGKDALDFNEKNELWPTDNY